jgi:phosphoglycolate phosphatase
VFRLIVFDLDGTLVDSRRDLADSANLLLEACGAGRLSEDAIGGMVGNGAPVLVARAFEAAGATPPADAVARFLTIYGGRLLRHTRPYPGIPEVLAALSARTALALLTNKPLLPTLSILEGLDLARFFDREAIVGGDGPFPRKPDGAGLRHLAARLSLSSQDVLLVGDSSVDVRTARSAAAAVCVARYGFGFAGILPAELGPADFAIDEPKGLMGIVGI